MKQKTAIIIGAGPAGLTAAYELQKNTDIKPIIFEASNDIGGISKTVNYKGNRIDIGGHRFFSKSDRVMEWWNEIMPIEKTDFSKSFLEKYRDNKNTKGWANPKKTDDVMLVRSRLSRIYYGRKFYDYPISLSKNTIKNLGLPKMAKIGFSYVGSKMKKRDESNLEGFYINRFGKELYETFFKDYTKKLWGIDPIQIDSSWGAQRVKGLSVSKVLLNALKPKGKVDLAQKNKETSLIEAFLYPKLGPGYLWEKVAKIVSKSGGEIHKNSVVTKLLVKDGEVTGVEVLDVKTNKKQAYKADYVLSTMPVNELIQAMDAGGAKVPEKVKKIASALPFRDFITVGVLADELKIKNETQRKTENNIIPDNWVYVQEPDVTVCRFQVFNNWSPYMVKEKKKIWIGMEYVVSEKDDIWNLSDKEMSKFAVTELEKIGILDPGKVNDTTVIHLKKTYPAYFGTYKDFDKVRAYVDKFPNLFLFGRNGQHHYNNQDHSMLTAMEVAQNIATGNKNKDNIWNVNVEKEYHESK